MAAATVTDTEFMFLLDLPRRFGPPLRHVRCELASGHADRHAAFVMAAEGGDRWWWIRWDRHSRELAQLGMCDGLTASDGDDCLLPAGHPGPHSYDL